MKRVVAAALVAALAATGATACSGKKHKHKATPLALESTPPPEPVTPQTARKAFDDFVAADAVARTAADERLTLWWDRDGQYQLTAADYRRALQSGTPVPQYRYDSPVFYVPRLRPKGTQWFVVRARRTTVGAKQPQTVMMGFVKTQPTGHWMLSLTSALDKKQKPPDIAVDAQGYAEPLATFDDSIVIQPRLVSAIQSTLAEEGPQNVAAKVMEAGPYTTGFYASDAKITKKKKAAGLRYTVVYTAASFPIFPLRTKDGGGVVLYALGRDAVTYTIKKKASGSPSPRHTPTPTPTPSPSPSGSSSGGSPTPTHKPSPTRVPIPSDAAALIDPSIVKDTIDVSETLQYVALVPPKPKSKSAPAGKARIIASAGGVVRASVPEKTD